MASSENPESSEIPSRSTADGASDTPLTTTDAMSDGDLLTRIGRGDTVAMEDIFQRYGRVVYSVALRVLRDAGAAEDVLQDIFLQIWRKPDAFLSTRGSLASWLAVVSRNRSIDQLRKRRPNSEIEDAVLASPFNLAESSEKALMVERARTVMATMPTAQRHALELAYFQGLTHTQIAAATGEPLGTVKTRIRNGLLTLKRQLQA